MASRLTPRTRARLEDVLDHIEAGAATARHASFNFTVEGRFFHVKADAFTVLSELRQRLRSSALLAGGPSIRAARALLGDALSIAVFKGKPDAVAHVEAVLNAKPKNWLVARRVNLIIDRPGPLMVGRCQLTVGAPSLGAQWPEAVDPQGPWIATEVAAQDEDSAAMVADQAFGEALAALQMVDPDGRSALARDVIVASAARSVHREQIGWPLVLNRYFNDHGDLVPPEYFLAAVAAKPHRKRTQLERSALAAARWYSLGVSSSWVSQALIAYMTALEALFIYGRSERTKGDLIAERVSRLVLGPQKTRIARRRWLKKMYDRRNAAVHESLDFLDEVDVERLQSVVGAALGWTLDHIDPSDGCSSTRAALDHTLRAASRRSP